MTVNIEESNISFDYLKKFNIAMSILHLVQGLLIFGLSLVIEDVTNFTQDIYKSTIKLDQLTGTRPIFAPDPILFFTFENIAGVLLASFLLMSAVAHFLIAYPMNNYYVENLKKKMNPLRWYEYALSSSVMIFFIALIFGVIEFWILALIFIVNVLMNVFGLYMEKINQYTEKTSWGPYFWGWVAGIMPWLVIVDVFINIGSRNVPTFVYIAIVMYFIFFNSFALNMFLQYKKVGPWKDYLFGERAYIILSLVSKSALGWIVFIGLFAGGG
ncbi:MAG: heliorhodopsin HeR [Candidatus Hodarchaeales archaeon]|jgi:hypothetical protein